MKMATAQACLTAAVKGQKRSTRVQLYKEVGQSAKKGRLATSLSKSLQIDRRTLLQPHCAPVSSKGEGREGHGISDEGRQLIRNARQEGSEACRRQLRGEEDLE